jgi:hypothetical protein
MATTETELVLFNVNENVRFKVLPRGLAVLKADHDALNASASGILGEWKPPEADADGWSKMQLWCVMRAFGPHFANGFDAPIETSIAIPLPPSVLWPADAKFSRGATVRKKGRASWRGKIVGWYRTELTALGYAVESAFEPGSVQIYPESALEAWSPK